MRLNFLKTQFSKFEKWYDNFRYRAFDYFEKVRFNSCGFDFSEVDGMKWMNSFLTANKQYGKKHWFLNGTFKTIIWILDFPYNVQLYWRDFKNFVAPDSFAKVDGKHIRTSDGNYSTFEDTAMFVLFEKFRQVFEETSERMGYDNLAEYDKLSQNVYLRQIQLYRWWLWRRNLNIDDLDLDAQDELTKTERQNVRELLEISGWI